MDDTEFDRKLRWPLLRMLNRKRKPVYTPPEPAPAEGTEKIMDEAAGREAVPETPDSLPPDGVLGYLVGFSYGERAGLAGTTHTTVMGLDEARAEARAHRVTEGRRWFPVEVREVPRHG